MFERPYEIFGKNRRAFFSLCKDMCDKKCRLDEG